MNTCGRASTKGRFASELLKFRYAVLFSDYRVEIANHYYYLFFSALSRQKGKMFEGDWLKIPRRALM